MVTIEELVAEMKGAIDAPSLTSTGDPIKDLMKFRLYLRNKLDEIVERGIKWNRK